MTQSWFSVFSHSFYHISVIPLLLLTCGLAWYAKPSTREPLPHGFREFRFNFLVVWCVCVAADWLHGPYVYALYAAYGFSGHEIARLFVAGFGASMVFGCFVGSFADKFGRKKTCLAYCLFYICSCLSKHFKSYNVLMFGRVTGGIATSMLFSGFECWMVSEHTVRNQFSSGLLSYMFGLMFSSMYLVAIAAGLAGQVIVNICEFSPISEGSIIYVGGYVGAFDLAILCMLLGLMLILTLWSENFGELSAAGSSSTGAHDSIWTTLSQAVTLLVSDCRVWVLGIISSGFEGAMYAFVFHWTPALHSETVPPPHGLIFATFMMACMCGASATTIMSNTYTPVVRLVFACVVGIIVFNICALCVGNQAWLMVMFLCFLIFEFCVGVYFPAIGVLKSQVVPENVRTTVYNLYRVPLNAVVMGLLLSDIPLVRCYHLCAILLVASCFSLGAISLGKRPAMMRSFSAARSERKEDV
eukprot:TRINITY_DN22994_c0_g1_i1.p1 TRINITY_DN22994_c0_g1~~TRINITY_DN22994_c0_g1_i1.p1  ORF type:complete len:471 (-),score=44.75 TRINITY_DN22994_c0_g1_i1:31-1443(-)